MNNISSYIKEFYFYYHTSAEMKRENPNELVIRTSLCKRSDFVKASFDALALYVNNVALATFYGIALVATVGLIPSFKASFCKNVKEGIVHAGTLPISIVGVISPQTINQNFLKLVPMEFKQKVKFDTLADLTQILGDFVFRKRWQLSSKYQNVY